MYRTEARWWVVLVAGLVGCGAAPPNATPATSRAQPLAATGAPCTSNADCDQLSFCDTSASGSCSGAGVCASRGINLFCANVDQPVCGCDGNTYKNECLMHKPGVAKAHDGPCESACQSNDDCAPLEYCKKPDGQCDAAGSCARRGITLYCVQRDEPVCGCDGVTYRNGCYALKAGASIASSGACGVTVADPPATECQVDADCGGILPRMCKVCDDGSEDCLHWSCVDGSCASGWCGGPWS